MNDGKGKKKNVFLWDSESDEEDDDYPNPRGKNFPTHTLHIKSSGFGDIGGDLEEILILEGGQITNLQTSEERDDDAHPKSEPSAP